LPPAAPASPGFARSAPAAEVIRTMGWVIVARPSQAGSHDGPARRSPWPPSDCRG
jgi:hypothetical protein